MTKINPRPTHNKYTPSTVSTISNDLKNRVMRKFILAVAHNTQPLSKKLLFTCFMAGYLLATLIFAIFSHQVHQFLDQILQRV